MDEKRRIINIPQKMKYYMNQLEKAGYTCDPWEDSFGQNSVTFRFRVENVVVGIHYDYDFDKCDMFCTVRDPRTMVWGYHASTFNTRNGDVRNVNKRSFIRIVKSGDPDKIVMEFNKYDMKYTFEVLDGQTII